MKNLVYLFLIFAAAGIVMSCSKDKTVQSAEPVVEDTVAVDSVVVDSVAVDSVAAECL